MIQGWHFTAQPGVLRDGSRFALGETIRVEGEIVPCVWGLHASPTVLSALDCAPGFHLYRVELRGTIIPHGDPVDKHAASERVALAYVDARPLLRIFARQCALDVLHLWDAPPVVREYLLTGDESLRNTAGDAACNAAWDAARDARAARDAWAARAAWAAVWASAGDARAAVWASAWDAWAKQSERLDAWTIAYMESGTLPEVALPAESEVR